MRRVQWDDEQFKKLHTHFAAKTHGCLYKMCIRDRTESESDSETQTETEGQMIDIRGMSVDDDQKLSLIHI